MGLEVRLRIVVMGTRLDGGFSKSVQDAAVHIRINGVLKHRPDRNVEIIAEGEKIILEKFLTEIRYGESAPRITNVQTTYEEATGEFHGFLVR